MGNFHLTKPVPPSTLYNTIVVLTDEYDYQSGAKEIRASRKGVPLYRLTGVLCMTASRPLTERRTRFQASPRESPNHFYPYCGT